MMGLIIKECEIFETQKMKLLMKKKQFQFDLKIPLLKELEGLGVLIQQTLVLEWYLMKMIKCLTTSLSIPSSSKGI